MSKRNREQQPSDEVLRNLLDDDAGGDDGGDDSDFPVALGQEITAEEDDQAAASPAKFLGMSAGERAFLSVMLFLNVLVMGAALLFLTGRLQL